MNSDIEQSETSQDELTWNFLMEHIATIHGKLEELFDDLPRLLSTEDAKTRSELIILRFQSLIDAAEVPFFTELSKTTNKSVSKLSFNLPTDTPDKVLATLLLNQRAPSLEEKKKTGRGYLSLIRKVWESDEFKEQLSEYNIQRDDQEDFSATTVKYILSLHLLVFF